MKLAYPLIIAALVAGCGTTIPEVVYKDKLVAVTLPRSQYEVDDAPEPANAQEYMAMTPIGRKVEDGKLLLKYQKHIKHLRDRIESIWDATQAQKETIERKNP